MQSAPPARIWPWSAQSPRIRQAYLFAAVCALSVALYFLLSQLPPYSSMSGLAGLVILLVFGLVLLVVSASVTLVGPIQLGAASAGGTALYFAWSASTSTCTDRPSLASDLGVPTCSGLLVLAVVAGVLVALAGGASAFLLRRARLERSKKPLVALGVLAITILVTSSAIAISTPPAPMDGYTRGFVPLPFPIPEGTVFEVKDIGQPGAMVTVRVPAKGLEPIAIYGAWNSTDTICLYIAIVGFNFILQPPGVAYGPCGTNVTFHYPLAPATWTIQFYIPPTPPFESNVTIRIVQRVDIVY